MESLYASNDKDDLNTTWENGFVLGAGSSAEICNIIDFLIKGFNSAVNSFNLLAKKISYFEKLIFYLPITLSFIKFLERIQIESITTLLFIIIFFGIG